MRHGGVVDQTYQGCGPRVDELVLSASRDNHEISSFYFLILSIDRCLCNPRGESQSLVYSMNLLYLRRESCIHYRSHMILKQCFYVYSEERGTSYLISNIAPNWDRHEDNLGIESGPKHPAELC